MTDQEPEQRHPLAGGCVLLTLAGGAGAAVWATSPDVAILTLWAAGTSAIWWSARRRQGTDQPLPSPTERGTHTTPDLHEARKAAKVATDPNAIMTIVHPPDERAATD
jgi:hypothetical protein